MQRNLAPEDRVFPAGGTTRASSSYVLRVAEIILHSIRGHFQRENTEIPQKKQRGESRSGHDACPCNDIVTYYMFCAVVRREKFYINISKNKVIYIYTCSPSLGRFAKRSSFGIARARTTENRDDYVRYSLRFTM